MNNMNVQPSVSTAVVPESVPPSQVVNAKSVEGFTSSIADVSVDTVATLKSLTHSMQTSVNIREAFAGLLAKMV